MLSCLLEEEKEKGKEKEENWKEKKAQPTISPIIFHHHTYLT
jgi:hypothetical protein